MKHDTKQVSAAPGVSRNALLGGIAVAVILAAAGGFGLAKLTSKAAPEAAAEAGEAKKPAGAPDAVEMDANRIAASGLLVQPVSSTGLASEIVAQATVEAAPGAQAVLTARAAGSVSRINKRLGEPVRAGEVLALVESREASQIAAARSVAAAKADLAAKVLARERHLYEQRVSARQDLEAAQAEDASARAEARSAAAAVSAADVSRDGRYVMVTSPINGRITSAPASLGAFVQSETELFRVADASRLQVEAAVTAADARRIRPGDPAVLELNDGVTANAVVRSVTPGVDETTRAATVVLTLTGGQGQLQPGQAVRARITARQSISPGIVVPEEAVQTWEGQDVVFVRTKTGFVARPVLVGIRAAGRVEVASGLRAGENIVVKNAFLLKAELAKGEAEEE
ncbi:cobalt-zinc-cadmium efflux system membrane fusion protein [Phenylobacterium haematophilum]|uniref:Cobalt-zinc-cadmium efflux system membrane fusion protein n=1 Tax=Phenylobacterium haematophilum TaxID=98513 RepID=A0A840A5R4_9CAUL|nr:efflux RND transporter periplasmic adaptor subunit [Phenylobacterium haematophilum]MBB3892900.1 cobalt-zinc-cadmium efflux system membrane fusion protein [Phenylobacterium haematophilum]